MTRILILKYWIRMPFCSSYRYLFMVHISRVRNALRQAVEMGIVVDIGVDEAQNLMAPDLKIQKKSFIVDTFREASDKLRKHCQRLRGAIIGTPEEMSEALAKSSGKSYTTHGKWMKEFSHCSFRTEGVKITIDFLNVPRDVLMQLRMFHRCVLFSATLGMSPRKDRKRPLAELMQLSGQSATSVSTSDGNGSSITAAVVQPKLQIDVMRNMLIETLKISGWLCMGPSAAAPAEVHIVHAGYPGLPSEYPGKEYYLRTCQRQSTPSHTFLKTWSRNCGYITLRAWEELQNTIEEPAVATLSLFICHKSEVKKLALHAGIPVQRYQMDKDLEDRVLGDFKRETAAQTGVGKSGLEILEANARREDESAGANVPLKKRNINRHVKIARRIVVFKGKGAEGSELEWATSPWCMI
jgi:hypothetical protein